MEIVLQLLKFLAPFSYLVTTVLYVKLFFAEDEHHFQAMPRRALTASLLLHTGFLLALAYHYQRCPLGTLGEGLLFWAWILAIIHSLSEILAKTGRLGFFTLLPTTLGVAVAVTLLREGFTLPPEYQNSFFVFHIVASLSSYACFCMAAILAGMYLLQYRKLKAKRFDIIFRKLPPLEKLDKLSAIWSVLGSITMVIAAVIGWWWVRSGELEGMSLKELAIYLVLIVYLGAGLARRLFAFRGHRHAIVILIGFLVLLLVNILQTHGFSS